MKNAVTKNGFINTLKWNGHWFSDDKTEFSRLILPYSLNTQTLIDCNGIRKLDIQFLKTQTEDSNTFNKESLVYEVTDSMNLLELSEMNLGNILWAYHKQGIAFVNFGTIKEILNFKR